MASIIVSDTEDSTITINQDDGGSSIMLECVDETSSYNGHDAIHEARHDNVNTWIHNTASTQEDGLQASGRYKDHRRHQSVCDSGDDAPNDNIASPSYDGTNVFSPSNTTDAPTSATESPPASPLAEPLKSYSNQPNYDQGRPPESYGFMGQGIQQSLESSPSPPVPMTPAYHGHTSGSSMSSNGLVEPESAQTVDRGRYGRQSASRYGGEDTGPLRCDFAVFTDCNVTFGLHEKDSWVWHAWEHLDNETPKILQCCFCNETFHLGSKAAKSLHSQRSLDESHWANFTRLMDHIYTHVNASYGAGGGNEDERSFEYPDQNGNINSYARFHEESTSYPPSGFNTQAGNGYNAPYSSYEAQHQDGLATYNNPRHHGQDQYGFNIQASRHDARHYRGMAKDSDQKAKVHKPETRGESSRKDKHKGSSHDKKRKK